MPVTLDDMNGIQNRRNSFEDGVWGTTCPIPPGRNFTYTLQMKDQIGSFFYFPSLAFHKAAGGFGAIKILSRPQIPVPFDPPTDDYSKTYRLRICNIGLQNSLNIRIQGHKMKVVEVEGTHTMQISYSSLDIHVGQCMSVLVTADQPPQEYYIVVSTRFTTPILTTTGYLRYANSNRQLT
ncbi:SKU5 similar 5 [Striga asiatica]|uniref:SKU5 similar 5 n=1 Tax=Striga asiatica TaxID=4170 RepID=A0A5A7Q4G6_STRAF|nr:SKU5 similar 5 [Striga asiatica]